MVTVHHGMEHMAIGVGGWPLKLHWQLRSREREIRKCGQPIKFQSAPSVTASVTFFLLKVP